MNALPLENLELRALEERNHLHDRATELKGKINETRDKLDPRNIAREHFLSMAIVTGAVSLICGYTTAGLFTRE
jgi:hypothetical protein